MYFYFGFSLAISMMAVSCFGARGKAAELQWASVEKQRGALLAMQSSLQKQKESVRRQVGLAATAKSDFFLLDSALDSASGPTFDCEALSEVRLGGLAEKAASTSRVPVELIRAVMHQESAGFPCAVSEKGAQGLMQLMPATAADLGVEDPFNPDDNVNGGARLLRSLLDRYSGNVVKALGAYNAGPARVDEAGGLPPFPQTVTYVNTIMKNLNAKR